MGRLTLLLDRSLDNLRSIYSCTSDEEQPSALHPWTSCMPTGCCFALSGQFRKVTILRSCVICGFPPRLRVWCPSEHYHTLPYRCIYIPRNFPAYTKCTRALSHPVACSPQYSCEPSCLGKVHTGVLGSCHDQMHQ